MPACALELVVVPGESDGPPVLAHECLSGLELRRPLNLGLSVDPDNPLVVRDVVESLLGELRDGIPDCYSLLRPGSWLEVGAALICLEYQVRLGGCPWLFWYRILIDSELADAGEFVLIGRFHPNNWL